MKEFESVYILESLAAAGGFYVGLTNDRVALLIKHNSGGVSTPHKQHKMNADDWRNRRKRGAYEIAVGDMLALTDKANAPWHLVPADNKRYARLEVLRSASRQIEAALEV